MYPSPRPGPVIDVVRHSTTRVSVHQTLMPLHYPYSCMSRLKKKTTESFLSSFQQSSVTSQTPSNSSHFNWNLWHCYSMTCHYFWYTRYNYIYVSLCPVEPPENKRSVQIKKIRVQFSFFFNDLNVKQRKIKSFLIMSRPSHVLP